MFDWLLLFCAALKQDLARKHKDAVQSCKSHNLALLKSNQQAEQEVSRRNLNPCDHYDCRKVLFGVLIVVCCFHQSLEMRVREEQKMMDKKIVAEMDQKVIDQQNTLEKAGVPGFFITTNPQVNASTCPTHCGLNAY